jgi:hypothetical protein
MDNAIVDCGCPLFHSLRMWWRNATLELYSNSTPGKIACDEALGGAVRDLALLVDPFLYAI